MSKANQLLLWTRKLGLLCLKLLISYATLDDFSFTGIVTLVNPQVLTTVTSVIFEMYFPILLWQKVMHSQLAVLVSSYHCEESNYLELTSEGQFLNSNFQNYENSPLGNKTNTVCDSEIHSTSVCPSRKPGGQIMRTGYIHMSVYTHTSSLTQSCLCMVECMNYEVPLYILHFWS